LRDLNKVVIFRPSEEKVVWQWGEGVLDGQHYPVILPDDTLLVFDNGREHRKHSRVLKLDMITKQIVWEYKSDPPESFYTKTIGGAFPLPNGNLLVTEGRKGRVFELTPDQDIVWQFEHDKLKKYREWEALPEKKRPKLKGKEHFIFRMERYQSQYFHSSIEERLLAHH
jgi:hypothetical protein